MMSDDLRSRFIKALSRPPLDLLERLDRAEEDTIWMMGTALDRLETELVDASVSFSTLHVCDPSSGDNQPERDAAVRRYDGRCLERLGNFQQGTFDVCIACWMIGTIPVNDTLSMLYRTLNQDGQIGLIAMKEGSPERPLQLLRSSVREVTGEQVQFRSRGQLTDTGSFRSLIGSLGFGEERVWNGDLRVSFRSPGEVYRILRHSTGTNWEEQIGDGVDAVRRRFEEKLEDTAGSTPEVTYAYLGATAHSL